MSHTRHVSLGLRALAAILDAEHMDGILCATPGEYQQALEWPQVPGYLLSPQELDDLTAALNHAARPYGLLIHPLQAGHVRRTPDRTLIIFALTWTRWRLNP